jgi:poly-gamma-glutamate capsule biosynthesis protein CapA/YwtB (metallophosphatase superfamily)
MIKKNYFKILVLFFLVLIVGLTILLFKPRAIPTSINPSVSPTNYNPPTTTSLFFAGDIMLSRNVIGKVYAANDYNLPFDGIKDETSNADIAFANLESPFRDGGDHSIEGSLVFNADPKAIEGLQSAGFDIVSTANNHTFDQGLTWLQYTYDYLKQNNIIPIGTTTDCHNGEIITRNDIKFGFLAYSYTAYNDGGKTPDARVCDANDLTQVASDIHQLRSSVDQLFVSVHMGIEYTRTPNEFGVKFAHNAIDAGADFIIGHHPHWIQTIEQYQGKWIFYSLGNFIFDQMWSQDTREGLAVKINFTDKKLSNIELKPVIIDNYCCPRWANELETKSILKKIDLTSPIL